MQRKIAVLAVLLFAVGTVVPVLAETPAVPVPAGGSPALDLAVLENSDAESCPVTNIITGETGKIRFVGSCTPYGYVCDPRWYPDAVCCPGTSCYSPYPGVPKYCL